MSYTKYINPDFATWESLILRPKINTQDITNLVSEIFTDIRDNGDKAVIKYAQKFDGANCTSLKISRSKIENATVPKALEDAIQLAKINIEKFHKAQRRPSIAVETTEGVHCWQVTKPIEKVGLYIPGGTAPLFSTILMLALPAKLAGCKEIVLCTPPNKGGGVDNAILYAAKVCGINAIYTVGGIQAIAAMTFGTSTIPKVYKIFGPGNQYVTAAKQMATSFGVGIDLPAGPSELLVYADRSAKADFVAADLLSQAEHGEDSQVICIAKTENILDKIIAELNEQVTILPRRDIALIALQNSKFICFNDDRTAVQFINEYAPEHLSVVSENETFFVENINNAGSVFLGNYTPESVGDYASGTNHTLPTSGYARAFSGVQLDSFTKQISFQKVSKEGLENIGKSVEIMASTEGLEAHKNAVTIRLNKIYETGK